MESGSSRAGALHGKERRQWLITEALVFGHISPCCQCPCYPVFPSNSQLSGWVFCWRPTPSGFFCLSILLCVSRVWQGGSCPECCLGRRPIAHQTSPTSSPCLFLLSWSGQGGGPEEAPVRYSTHAQFDGHKFQHPILPLGSVSHSFISLQPLPKAW